MYTFQKILSGLLALVLLASFGTAFADNDTARVQANLSTVSMTLKEARDLALAQAGGGKVLDAELDYEDGMLVFDIIILNGNTETELTIDALSSEVLKTKSKIEDAEDVAEYSVKLAISLDEAEKAAQEAYPALTVIKADLEKNGGIYVYEFKLVDATTVRNVHVDANTGAIVKDTVIMK